MYESEQLTLPTGAPERLTGPDGLTEAEAAQRLAAGKGNAAAKDDGRTPLEIVAKNLFTWFNLLNVLLALALALVGAWRNMLFMGVVVSNTLIGTIQELRARKTVARLKLLAQTPAAVRRDGAEKRVSPDALVEGDLVVLRAGDQVPADAVVREGSGSADESLLTGESDPVTKAGGDWLYSGSAVVSGSFTAQLVHVGEASYANRLTRQARKIKPPKSALMADLNKLVRFVSIALIPIGLLLLGKQLWMQNVPVGEAVPGAVAAMVGMIPEGLILLTSVAQLPMYLAAGTSAFAVLVGMVTSITTFMFGGTPVYWPLIGIELAGIVLGSWIGPMTSKFISDVWLKRLFVVVALIVGVNYVLRGFFGMRLW